MPDRPLSLGPLHSWGWGSSCMRTCVNLLSWWFHSRSLTGRTMSDRVQLAERPPTPPTLFTLDHPVAGAIVSSGITTPQLCSAPDTAAPTAGWEQPVRWSESGPRLKYLWGFATLTATFGSTMNFIFFSFIMNQRCFTASSCFTFNFEILLFVIYSTC